MASVKPRQTKAGRRWDVRYRNPDGDLRRKTFLRKVDADRFASTVEADKYRGDFIDPQAGREKLREFAERWLKAQTFDRRTRELVSSWFRLHLYPTLGDKPIGSIRPMTIQEWLGDLTISPAYQAKLYGYTSTVFRAACDDGVVAKNPCAASSVRRPRIPARKVTPWPFATVTALANAIEDRYRALVITGAGLGLRQGELFALSPDDIDTGTGLVHVQRQVKLFDDGTQVFAPPKGTKTRTVPLPVTVSAALSGHEDRHPLREVTLPWVDSDGPLVTAYLFFTDSAGRALHRNRFNSGVWKPAQHRAGIASGRDDGCHALRHHYASVLLDAGESIKALSEYLGHYDAGFTLRTYTHLMPGSETRTRHAIDNLWTCATNVPRQAA